MQPLFLQDLGLLRSQLRLSGSTSADSEALLAAAVLGARVTFFSRLGELRVATIKAEPPSLSPTTVNQILRSKAELCETALVRRECLRTMPAFTMEHAAAPEIWNEDGIVRARLESERQKEIDRLTEEIEAFLTSLSGSDDTPGVRASVIGPTYSPSPPPGVYDWTFSGAPSGATQ